MSSDAESWPYAELAKFEVVALGCHRKLHAELARFFRKHGIEAFQLVEYFLLEPVNSESDASDNMMYFPFLRRLLEHNSFHLRGQHGSLNVIPLTSDLRENVEFYKSDGWSFPRRYVLPFSEAIIGQNIFKLWLEGKSAREVPSQNWFQPYSKAQWDQHEELVQKITSEYSEIYNNEFDLAARFWKACADGISTMVGGYPICSEGTFYGYFVVVWPEPYLHISNNEKKPNWGGVESENIVKYLETHSQESYLPTLALLHNSIWEDRFHRTMKPNANKEDLTKEIDALPVGRWSQGTQNLLERGLAGLWEKRKELLKQPDGIEAVKDTLLFRKYNIASPGMVKQIQKIIQRAPHFCQSDDGSKLPAALVYGEAGAGKDTMARLIQLFTLPSWKPDENNSEAEKKPLGYFGLKPNTINMSALKPNSLFGPLFQGMNVSDLSLNVPSILTLYKNPNGDESVKNHPGVFIFDELNSLDIDLQGVLLRILENGEVTPLFDINPTHVGHLVIGVVNEDPEILMRENETKNLKQIKDFSGEFIGNALYEFFMKGRRLRPDLFYRLSRGLYIRLPSLRERREDIPILFYFECEDATKQELRNVPIDDRGQKPFWETTDNEKKEKEPCLYVEMKAYESLMGTSLDWPGNVRQLQAVATEAAILSVKEYVEEGRKNRPGIIYVRNETVVKVLSQHFPSAFPEYVDGKYDHRRSHAGE